ncbi:MAG: entericidin A/B family lipoprotein [Nitrososphaera sp.]
MWNARSGALWFAVTLCTVNLSACNTVAGFGKDMQNVGQKIVRKIDQRDSSDARSQEVRPVEREARTEPKGQKASLTVPATRQVVERKLSEDRQNQEREGTNPDNEVDNTQIELERMFEEQMQR